MLYTCGLVDFLLYFNFDVELYAFQFFFYKSGVFFVFLKIAWKQFIKVIASANWGRFRV